MPRQETILQRQRETNLSPKIATLSTGFSLGMGLLQGSIKRPVAPYCARGARESTVERHIDIGIAGIVRFREDPPSIVVGHIGREGIISEEIKRTVGKQPGDLFQQIRKAQRTLRPFPKRLLSLKTVAGFGIYECHPEQNRHSIPDIDRETERTLIHLFWDYQNSKYDYNNYWLRWIQSELNGRGNKYALRLILRWSVLKIVVWGITPILLSLAIGFWYMYKPHAADADIFTIVQTAWTISSYIVTTAACEYLLLAGVSVKLISISGYRHYCRCYPSE
jgi:hypothetical protein